VAFPELDMRQRPLVSTSHGIAELLVREPEA